MAYGIRVTLDDGTTRLYSKNEDCAEAATFATRQLAEERVRGLSWWWSRPHPDGKGGTKPFYAFEVVEVESDG